MVRVVSWRVWVLNRDLQWYRVVVPRNGRWHAWSFDSEFDAWVAIVAEWDRLVAMDMVTVDVQGEPLLVV